MADVSKDVLTCDRPDEGPPCVEAISRMRVTRTYPAHRPTSWIIFAELREPPIESTKDNHALSVRIYPPIEDPIMGEDLPAQ
jgi:hypothetical protein